MKQDATSRGRVSGGAQHTDVPGGVLDDGEDVLTLSIERDGLDEVAGQNSVGLRTQEVGPRAGRPLWSRVDTFLFEDLPDRGRSHRDARVIGGAGGAQEFEVSGDHPDRQRLVELELKG
ncbi:hypothetical protein [Microtetraspora fusca]|uniref:Uncharacterized protein n=1 Tax=Microtetraspora fusca TaxID=1997 RepID=A0ABW6VLY4_MICFU|nr:hypothetical protein [Microtetraspora fusca]